MKVSILTTDPGHPVVPPLRAWRQAMISHGHEVALVFDRGDLPGGEILFLVSCGQVIREAERARYGAVLVLHASDLPRGRGWSPHIWSIVRGGHRITLCMLEAKEPVDSGPVWLRTTFDLEGHELLAEINEKLFAAELELMTRAVEEHGRLAPEAQDGDPGEYMKKRSKADSRLDPAKSIAEQFDLLRVVDNDRYPAFFEHRGHRYTLRIEKAND